MVTFHITVKLGPKTLTEIKGRPTSAPIDPEKIIETEQYLEKLTGLRYHIEYTLEG